MDAVKFLKEKRRMCSAHPLSCRDCPMLLMCSSEDEFDEAEAVSAVEKWAKEHPTKTRASEFLKQYPNAEIIATDKLPKINPCTLDTTIREKLCKDDFSCSECCEKYWLEEIE